MKTTVDLLDELYRRAKAEAALHSQKFSELVAEGLARILEAPAERLPKAKVSALMKRARGAIYSGVSDLGSNPEHLSGFGRSARHC